MARVPVAYDADVIQESAHRLYKQAASIVGSWTVLGVLIGLLAGVAGVAAIQTPSNSLFAALLGGLVGGVMGYARGQANAFRLKLEAQVALCQVQIERNTNGSSVP